MNSEYTFVGKSSIISENKDLYTISNNEFTLYDPYRPLDNLYYVIQDNTSEIILEGDQVKEKNFYESHISLTQGSFELLTSPYSKIYNNYIDTSYVILFYINATTETTFDYKITANVNNLYHSIQPAISSINTFSFSDIINGVEFVCNANDYVAYKVNIPKDIQIGSLKVSCPFVDSGIIYIIIQRDTEIVELENALIKSDNYIESYIDNSETSVREIIPVGRELKGGYEEGGTNYVILFYSSPQEVNKLDSSYIRENRIDLIQNLDVEKKNN